MADLEVSFGGLDIDALSERLTVQVREELQERLSELVAERVEEALNQSALWVPRLLTNKQLSYILQVPETRSREMTSRGDIPRIHLPPEENSRTYRVDPRDLNLWLEAHQDFPARREELQRIIEEGRAMPA